MTNLEKITLEDVDLRRITRLHDFEKSLLAMKCHGVSNVSLGKALGVHQTRVNFRYRNALIKAAHIIYSPYHARPSRKMMDSALKQCMQKGYIHAPRNYDELRAQHELYKHNCNATSRKGLRFSMTYTGPEDKSKTKDS